MNNQNIKTMKFKICVHQNDNENRNREILIKYLHINIQYVQFALLHL